METAVVISTLVHRLKGPQPYSAAAFRKAMKFQGGWMAPRARAAGIQGSCVQRTGGGGCERF